jgi:hypothetical protein
MRVRILLAVFELGLELGNEPPQKTEHIGLNIRVRVLIHRQPARRVLNKQHANTIAIPRQTRLNLARDIDHLFAGFRLYLDDLHS